MTTPMLHRGPGAPPGGSRRDLEHARWRNLGYGRTHVQPAGAQPVQVGPMLRRDEAQYRLAYIRCEGCGDMVGEIFSVLREWQGRPFTWAESWWITDREARPMRTTRYSMILDRETADGRVETECSTHGILSVEVQDLLDGLPALLNRLGAKGRPGKVMAQLARS